jgi:xylulokinase
MYKSALEGVAYSIAQHLDIISEHQQPLTKIMAVGGGTKNKLWLQIIADVTGHDIQTAKITIGASFGDALMAAVAAGNSESFADLDEKIAPAEVYKPNPENRAVYARHRKVFDELYQRTKDLMREL